MGEFGVSREAVGVKERPFGFRGLVGGGQMDGPSRLGRESFSFSLDVGWGQVQISAAWAFNMYQVPRLWGKGAGGGAAV